MHIPVLLKETIEYLSVKQGETLVDATLGGGGLSYAIAKKFGKDVFIIGFDADEDAVLRSEEKIKELDSRHLFKVVNFSNIAGELDELGYKEVQKIAFDLGLSSYQLEDSGRGFSFQRNELLKMTFSKSISSEDVDAGEIVNKWSEDVLKTIISSYGEERFAGRISKAIVHERKKRPIETTKDLVLIIERSVPAGYLRGRVHPATKTFQALRIAVNDEITALQEGLKGAFLKIASGGRIAVISFHSLEDRIVKRFFVEKQKEGVALRITKKPIRPCQSEIDDNPRSRSAKLRVLKKL